MNKLFIFDMDGVIVNSESLWEEAKKLIYHSLLGSEVMSKLGSTLGVNLEMIYERAFKLGANVDKERFLNTFFEAGNDIYSHAPLTSGLDDLVQVLKDQHYTMAVVSSSPLEWINIAVERLSFRDDLTIIISLHDVNHLQHKPAPDGYHEAMRRAHVSPESTVILEDSNVGIASAKASGAFTIALKANLPEGYKQEGADAYAKDLAEVIQMLDALRR